MSLKRWFAEKWVDTKLVSPAADRKVKSVRATQLVDHLNVYHLRHLRLLVKCLRARRLASIGLKQVANE